MKIKRDDINSDFKNLEQLIKNHNDDKLLYAFYNYVDKLTKLDQEILDHSSRVLKNDNDLAKIDLENKKNFNEFNDRHIEFKNELNSIKKEYIKKTDEIKEEFTIKLKKESLKIATEWSINADKKFEAFTRSAYLHPRFNGLFLLIRGQSHIMDVNKLCKEALEDKDEKEKENK